MLTLQKKPELSATKEDEEAEKGQDNFFLYRGRRTLQYLFLLRGSPKETRADDKRAC